MNTTNGKTFHCCGKEFRYYSEVDKLESPPDDKRLKIIHACDRFFAARINLTMYYVKNSKVENTPVTPAP
jgi:hypothetical protein